MKRQWNDKIVSPVASTFTDMALETFRFQFDNNRLYQDYVNSLRVVPAHVTQLEQIPFLPIRFFKSHSVQTGDFIPEFVFESSGTTGSINSRHLVKDLHLYRNAFDEGFRKFYGEPADWCIIGLLPSYLERRNSSLVYMVNDLIAQSGQPLSGFYLDEFDKLNNVITQLEKNGQKTLLIGVTFALLDFADYFERAHSKKLTHTIIMETGGMKGRREEMVREQLHERLRAAFGVSSIHSEYGMTELLSQAYSKEDGLFYPSPSLKILIRDEEDPLDIKTSGSGAINIIDLANKWSCSFIATDDAGRLFEDGSFEVIGRLDNTDLRGCSLLSV